MEKIDCKILELVDRAANGKDALDIVERNCSKGIIYGLIFMDCNMPIMDGYDSTKSIRETYRKCKVQQPMIIACTGHTEPEYIDKAWRHEMDEVVAKPVPTDVIVAILESMIDV